MSDLVVWTGDTNNLPPAGEKFIYKDVEYIWKPCTCKEQCLRPKAYKGGEMDLEMTIRLRGTNQGVPLLTVLVKLGKME